jgi:hypothetical protein
VLRACLDSPSELCWVPSMPHGFEAYRVFISAPGDLERDRQACHDAIAEANESTAMPAKVLLVEVGLRDNEQISGHRSIVSDNVRWSTYFIQLFEDDWGPRDLFRKLFLLAVECRDDPAMPMRDVVVCLKDAPRETNPEILAFRKELEEIPNDRVFRYGSIDLLKEHLRGICEGWARDAIELAKTAADKSVSPAPG